MINNSEQLSLINEHAKVNDNPVVCLGMTFKNDEERRAYFREELRRKLPELKQVEGFPIGEDEEIIALSDPPYYTTCPNPWVKDIMKYWATEERVNENDGIQSPFVADVSEGKNDRIYKTHGYHTKVPYKAIMKYILHYTKPGDIVFDGFSGTGMTGVAAQMCNNETVITELGYKIDNNNIYDEYGNFISQKGNRKAVLNDLSSAAYFISSNFTKKIDKFSYKEAIKEAILKLEKNCSWMYVTKHTDGTNGRITSMVWSDVFSCPMCLNEMVYWDVGVNSENQQLKKTLSCPNCQAKLNKRKLNRVWTSSFNLELNKVIKVSKQKLVSISYSVGSKRYEKTPDESDLQLLKKIEEQVIQHWIPTDELPEGYNTNQPLKSHGLSHTNLFYTKRSLITLSTYMELIKNSPLRNELMMLLTGVTFSTTKLYRWTPNYQGGGPLSGTLYIPSLYREISVLDALKRFAIKLPKNLTFDKNIGDIIQSVGDAGTINVPENSVDYIFIDPPFGANIMYSELNYLWESWLKVKTNNNMETIVNETQNKDILDYQNMMTDSFKNFYKSLKPNKWITVEFSNSQASVWNTIQESMQRAGFVIANVATLDKKQGSFKAVTSTTAVKQDLVISAYKPSNENIRKMQEQTNTPESAWIFVSQHLEKLPVFSGVKGEPDFIAERTPRILFDRMVAFHVQSGLSVPISSSEFQRGVSQRFPMRDGMAFLDSQVAEYDKKRILINEFSQMNLFVSDENSAIEWIRQQLMKKPQTRQDLHPQFMKEIQHIAKHEQLPEIDELLLQNFLRFEGDTIVPDQIASYLRRNYREFRGLDNNNEKMKVKAENYWYVPDPNKQADLEKLREKTLLREFDGYLEELATHKKKLRHFRTEAVRAGFKKAWTEKDYKKIVTVGERLPETVIQEDDKLLMYYDNAQIRIEM